MSSATFFSPLREMATVSLASPPDVSIRVSHSSPSRSSTAGRSFTYPPIAATSATSAMYSMARNIYGCGTRLSRSVCLSDARSGSPWPLSQGCSAGRVTLPAGAMHIHPRDTVTANPYPSGLGFPTLGSPAGGPVPLGGGCDICRLCVVPFPCPIPGPARPFPSSTSGAVSRKRSERAPPCCSTTRSLAAAPPPEPDARGTLASTGRGAMRVCGQSGSIPAPISAAGQAHGG